MVSDKGAVTTMALAGLGDGRRTDTGGETALAAVGGTFSNGHVWQGLSAVAKTLRQCAGTSLTVC
jgi:hypothetical protein